MSGLFIIAGIVVLGVGAYLKFRPHHASQPTTPTSFMDPSVWQIGPIIDGQNYSHNVPLNPEATSDGWKIEFPTSDGVHYVTAPQGSLDEKIRISIEYRIEADPGVNIIPSTDPKGVSVGPTLYFESVNDDWNTDGLRWWATFNTKDPIVPGTYRIDAPLNGPWTSVNTMTEVSNPTEFASCKKNCGRVGFTFGGGTGYGHGVYATGPAKIVVTKFEVA